MKYQKERDPLAPKLTCGVGGTRESLPGRSARILLRKRPVLKYDIIIDGALIHRQSEVPDRR